MTIQYCSDLHLEFFENRKYLKENPLEPIGEVLILAGDICHFSNYYFSLSFFDQISDAFELVLMIPGNHEYYGGKDLNITNEPFLYKVRKNVWLCNNENIDYKGVKFILTTLWSMISMKNSQLISMYMTDFRLIRLEKKIITTADYNHIHQRSLQFLEKALSEEHAKKVVITHHLPSELCNAEEFKSSPINEAFCVDLTETISKNDAKYWVYGHSHRNMPEISINHTTLLTNQLGYISQKEHHSFNNKAVFFI